MARPIEMETLLMATARNEMDRPSYQSVNDPWRSKRERAYLGGLNWATRTTGGWGRNQTKRLKQDPINAPARQVD